MTPEQESHLRSIKNRITTRLDTKYRNGQEDHGGNLWDRRPLPELLNEITDLISYAHCLEDDVKAIEEAVVKARIELQAGNWQAVMKQLDDIYSRVHNPKPF